MAIDVEQERKKHLAEIEQLRKQLTKTEAQIARAANLYSQRELLLLAIAERKGIIAFLNSLNEDKG